MGLRTNSLNMSDERNPNVHDIKVRDYIDSGSSGVCSEDASTIRGSVDLDGDFWQHVHPDELNVYDFSGFVNSHAGHWQAGGGTPFVDGQQTMGCTWYIRAITL